MQYTIVDDNVEAAPIYRCQWKCWTAYSKVLQESCPAYGIGTYMDRKSTEATDTVKSSSASGSLDTTKIQGT